MKSRAEFVSEAVLDSLGESSVGVVVDGFGELDVQQVVSLLAKRLPRLFACVVGYNSVRKTKSVEVQDRIEAAVKWRNQPACAGAIVVFLRHEVPKTHSLEKFRRIRQRDVSERLLRAAQSELASNDPERHFWDALLRDRQEFPLQLIERFVETVGKHRGKSNDRIPKSLWALGLVCDDDVVSRTKDPADRLQRNRQAIEDIGQLSEQSRRRMAQVIGSYSGAMKRKFNSAYQSVMEFFKRGDLTSLQSLDLETLETLIKSGKALPKQDGSAKSQDSADKPTTNPDRPLRGKRLTATIVEAVASQDKDRLEELAEFADGLVTLFGDPGEAPESFSIGSQLVEPTSTDEHWNICRAIAHCCDASSWGGWFESESTSVKEAFRNFVPESFHPHDPSQPSTKGAIELLELLDRFDKELKQKSGLGKVFRKLASAREKLVEHGTVLMCYPFVVLATDCTFRKLLPIFEIGLTKQMALLACCWLFNPNTHRRAKDGKME
ncbi:MAG: hypothetical protein AB7O62_05550, partial [Pirellulales bacterium]